MKTIRIGRLDLNCRGIQPGVARGALCELDSALTRQLSGRAAEGHRTSALAESAAIRIGTQITPAGLADAVAARVAETVRARITSGGGGHSS
jgi:hypothetical protein